MKAISIKQPWASLIVEGIKDIENRTWKCPKKYIGQRVLIHAAAMPWGNLRKDSCIGHILTREQYNKMLQLGLDEAREFWLDDYQFGAIIGSVEIVGCEINHSSIWAEKCETNCSERCRKINCEHFIDWDCGEGWCASCKLIGQSYEVNKVPKDCPHKMKIKTIYNWILANPIKFPEPIPAKGKLSFWDFEPDQKYMECTNENPYTHRGQGEREGCIQDCSNCDYYKLIYDQLS